MHVQELEKYTGSEIKVEIGVERNGHKGVLALTIRNFGRRWVSPNRNAAAVRNLAADALGWANSYVRNPQQFGAVVAAIAAAVQGYLTPTPVQEPTE
jgi:hypothetical protein